MAVRSADGAVERATSLTVTCFGGSEVELAQEDEFRDAFPDCELGAMPPFGNLYGMPVYVDSRLTGQAEIAFNAGSHTDVVRMPYSEFERLAQPELLWLAHVM